MSFKDWLFGKQTSDDFSIVDSNYVSGSSAYAELIDTSSDSFTVPRELDKDLNKNLEVMKVIYNTKINSDIVLRPFSFKINSKSFSAFIVYIDGLSDSDLINNFLLKPLMIDKHYVNAISDDITDYVYNFLLPQNSVKLVNNFNKIASSINSGNCVLFINTINQAFDIDVKNFKQRSVDTPSNETVIMGPQEAFVENIRTNTSLLRRIVNNENLVIENIEIGKISRTRCALCYMHNLTNR